MSCCKSLTNTCSSALPDSCEALPLTNAGVRLVVEDEQNCKKTIATPEADGLVKYENGIITSRSGAALDPLKLAALQQQAGSTLPIILGQLSDGTIVGIIKTVGASEPEVVIHNGTNWEIVSRSTMFGVGSGALCRASAGTKLASWKTGTLNQFLRINSDGDAVFMDGNPIEYAYVNGLSTKAALDQSDEVIIGDVAGTTIKKALISQLSPAGSVLQVQYAETKSRASALNYLVNDDDTPFEITEGGQVLSVSITPSNAANKILLISMGHFSANNGTSRTIAGLFKAGTTNALEVFATYASSTVLDFHMMSLESPATTSPIVYSLRGGSVAASNFLINDGYMYQSRYASSLKTMLMAVEIKG